MPERARPQLVCVYRQENARHVSRLVTQVRRLGGASHLWALDRVHPSLLAWTVGSGGGQRLALLNRLMARTETDSPLVVADDDVTLRRGGLSALLTTMARGQLELAQPAHSRASTASHRVTRRVSGSVARLTCFVEVGPLLVIAPSLRPLVTPFPEEFGMGWGLDVVWSDLAQSGHRLGVVDRVTMTHHGVVGASYDNAAADALLARALHDRGYLDMEPLNRTLAVWKAWGPLDPRRRAPRWR